MSSVRLCLIRDKRQRDDAGRRRLCLNIASNVDMQFFGPFSRPAIHYSALYELNSYRDASFLIKITTRRA